MERITLITGGSRGIGSAAAKLCAEAGHAVAVNYVSNVDKANTVAAAIRDAGGIAIHSSGDIYLTGFTGGELDGNSTFGNKDV